MAALIIEASVCRLTVGGERFYPWESSTRLTVRFSKTRTHCYLPDGTILRRIKGGAGGGNFEEVHTGDIYRVWQHK